MLNRMRQLSRQERRDLWPALWRLACVRASLLTRGIRGTLMRCGGTASGLDPALDKDDLQTWRRRALAFRRTARLIPQARCLARSLALRWWMRSHGIQAELKIGVRKTNGQIDSHSWVIVGNTPIDETPDNTAGYQVIQTESESSVSIETLESRQSL